MKEKIFATGSIIPLGDGLTGKTLLSRILINLDQIKANPTLHQQLIQNTKKSLNLELEYSHATVTIEGKQIHTSQQYYIFPGQRLKDTMNSITFDDILKIFSFLPGIQSIDVLLLVYDTTRFMSLKSLELWFKIALTKKWVHENTLLVLISNKIDLKKPEPIYVNSVLYGIEDLLRKHGITPQKDQVRAIQTSCITLEGLDTLREWIVTWIAKHGKKSIRYESTTIEH